MIYNAKNLSKQDLEGFDIDLKDGRNITGWLIDGRVDTTGFDPSFHAYALRHSDEDDMAPVSLEQAVLVNHFGTFITKSDLLVQTDSNVKPYIDIVDYNYQGGYITTKSFNELLPLGDVNA